MQIKSQLFKNELILFASAMAMAMFATYQFITGQSYLQTPASISFSKSDLIMAVILILFLIFASRFRRISNFAYRFILLLIVFIGSESFFSSFLNPPWDLFSALILLIIFITFKNVFIHNIAVILGVAGIGSVLGLAITPKIAVVLLVAFSVYDILAVYVTKHMITMARGMIQSGAIFGFIIPAEVKDFKLKKSEALIEMGGRFMLLGSGDIGLPIVLVASVMRQSLTAATITAVFSLIGLFLTHLIFINQKERKPMAALPPIATMSIIGYLVSLLI